jgi:hypothetical protein
MNWYCNQRATGETAPWLQVPSELMCEYKDHDPCTSSKRGFMWKNWGNYTLIRITGWMTGFRSPSGCGIFSLRHCVQTGSRSQSAYYPMGTRKSFSRGKAAGSSSWHSPPSSAEVKNGWRSTASYVFMAWYLVKHRDNFTFTFIRELCNHVQEIIIGAKKRPWRYILTPWYPVESWTVCLRGTAKWFSQRRDVFVDVALCWWW